MRKLIAAASTLIATAVFLVVPATASDAAPMSAARCSGCTVGF